MADPGLFAFSIPLALAERFVEIVKSVCQSKTIADNLVILPGPEPDMARVVALPYWSEWYHNGLNVVKPDGARVLVWFKDPSKDPRKPTNIFGPGRALTADEFRDFNKQGLLVVRMRSGPSKPHPFFQLAAQQFVVEATGVTEDAIRQRVLGELEAAGLPGLTSAFTEAAAIARLSL